MTFDLARLPLFVAVSLCLPLTVDAEPSHAPSTAQRWEVVEWSFLAPSKPSRPFAVEFGAVLTHPDGDSQVIPGFFDGGRRWRLRFCPHKIGDWSYTTYSSTPELAGRKGRVEVVENRREWQHGPIETSASSPQRFVYADGAPYFLMAFELDWLFALDAENEHDVPRSRELVSAVADHGFNQIVMNVYAYDATWGEREKMLPEHN
ncbi:MAG: DUF5060 domain-containing protein, partial [Planctomycetota bacterium]